MQSILFSDLYIDITMTCIRPYLTQSSSINSQTVKSKSPLHISNALQPYYLYHKLSKISYYPYYETHIDRQRNNVFIAATRFGQDSQKRAWPQGTSGSPSRGATKQTSHVSACVCICSRTCVFKSHLLPSMWPVLVKFHSASSESRP